MKTDIQLVRELFEKLGIPYTTTVQNGTIFLGIRTDPTITFSFSQETGEAYSIYNLW